MIVVRTVSVKVVSGAQLTTGTGYIHCQIDDGCVDHIVIVRGVDIIENPVAFIIDQYKRFLSHTYFSCNSDTLYKTLDQLKFDGHFVKEIL